jgi:hypothetical protein
MKSLMSKAGLAAVAMSAMLPARAEALDGGQFDYYCVGAGALQACASVRLQSVGNTLTMQVWNLYGTMGAQHTITAIGLYHSGGAAWNGTVDSYSVDYYPTVGAPQPINTSSFWKASKADDIKTLGSVNVEIAEGNNANTGIIGCSDPSGGGTKWQTCTNGQSSFPNAAYVQFTFGLSSAFSLNDVEVRWHSQQQAGDNSIKCDTNGLADDPCGPPVILSPEPATLALMGTGLLGVFGLARRRRRSVVDAA